MFISVVSTSPATLLGFGTWAAIGAGKMLLGWNTGDTLEATGGAATHGHSFNQPDAHGALSHSAHAGVTVGTSGAGSAHTHTQGSVTPPTIAWPAGVPTAATENAHTHTGASAGTTPKLFTSNTSTGVPGVSGGGTAHGHTLSWPAGVPTATGPTVANPANESAHTHAAGTVNQPNAHSDHAAQSHANGSVADGSTLPPYLIVRMWKRTA